MPDIDRTADIKVIAGQGAVNAEIPLAGHASEHWLQIFHSLVSKRKQELRAEAEDREDRTWVIVILPGALLDHHPESALDAARALISEPPAWMTSFSRAPLKPRPQSVIGGRVNSGSAMPLLVLTYCLGGRERPCPDLSVRRSANIWRYP